MAQSYESIGDQDVIIINKV